MDVVQRQDEQDAIRLLPLPRFHQGRDLGLMFAWVVTTPLGRLVVPLV